MWGLCLGYIPYIAWGEKVSPRKFVISYKMEPQVWCLLYWVYVLVLYVCMECLRQYMLFVWLSDTGFFCCFPVEVNNFSCLSVLKFCNRNCWGGDVCVMTLMMKNWFLLKEECCEQIFCSFLFTYEETCIVYLFSPIGFPEETHGIICVGKKFKKEILISLRR